MNKKIKVIELFNKIANGEEVPRKIFYKGETFIFNSDYSSIDNLYAFLQNNGVGWLECINVNLNDEVEILEDNTEEIEELPIELLDEKDLTPHIIKHFNKINELVKAVNSIRKDLNK